MAQLIEITDPDLAQQTLSQSYGRLQLAIREESARLRIQQSTVGPVDLQQVTFGMQFDAEIVSLGAHVFGRVTAGTMTYQRRGGRNDYAAGDAFLCAQPEQSIHAFVDQTQVETATIDARLLAEVADTAPGPSQTPIRFTGYTPVSPAAAAQWNRTYDYVLHHLADRAADTSPLLAGAGARLLAAAALSTFPNTALLEPTIQDRRDAHPATVRRAVAFIQSHPDLDLSVVDIAGAAFVTPRALQLAFRRHLGTTPVQYLRRVRLDRAHADLQVADPGTGTVTAIAARWGWARPSRFAADYLAAYGRHPHQTLRS